MYQYGFGAKWCNVFCFPNGVMVIKYFLTYDEMVKSLWCNGNMVKFSNGESIFLGHITING